MEPLLAKLAEHGPLGIICAVLAFWVWSKDQDLKKERDARIADAKNFTDLALGLQRDVIGAVNKLADIFEAIQRGPNNRPKGGPL